MSQLHSYDLPSGQRWLAELFLTFPPLTGLYRLPGVPLTAPYIDFLASHSRRPLPASTKTAIADFPHHAP